jgi:DNA-binding response OmpR family regulator
MTEAPRKARVLVVDDEPPLRELMVLALGDGFECIEAGDGASALELLRSESPDLVVLDVMLPDISGLDVLRELRGDPALRATPVVVVSAWQSKPDVDRAFEAGADRFLAKPFPVDDLRLTAEELMRSRA